MNKEELFYEAESKTARPHKYSIRYKHKDDTIYPSMVIRRQAEAIELLEKENQQLKNNRDKAIEYVEEKGRLKYNPNELIKLLKGDSDD